MLWNVRVLVTAYCWLDSVTVVLLSVSTALGSPPAVSTSHSTCGRGRPDTVHTNSTRVLSLTVWASGVTVMLGGAGQHSLESVQRREERVETHLVLPA